MKKSLAKVEIGKTAMLITDMIDGGATLDEVERATRYSKDLINAAGNDAVSDCQQLYFLTGLRKETRK